MSELYTRLEKAREHVDPHWDGRKVAHQLGALEDKLGARNKSRSVALSLALGGALAAAIALWTLDTAPSVPIAQRHVDTPAQVNAQQTEVPEPASAAPTTALEQSGLALAPQNPEDVAAQVPGEPAAAALAVEDAPTIKAHTARSISAAREWRSLARAGRYREAFTVLSRTQLDHKKSGVDDLLLAADSARLSGHPSQAVPLYREVFARHAKDPRANLAAFTLGRTLLYELGDAQKAAEAFNRAYQLAPRGPLAEEALAREAESWAKAGDQSRAQKAAERYLGAFPNGRLTGEVKRHGGM